MWEVCVSFNVAARLPRPVSMHRRHVTSSAACVWSEDSMANVSCLKRDTSSTSGAHTLGIHQLLSCYVQSVCWWAACGLAYFKVMDHQGYTAVDGEVLKDNPDHWVGGWGRGVSFCCRIVWWGLAKINNSKVNIYGSFESSCGCFFLYLCIWNLHYLFRKSKFWEKNLKFWLVDGKPIEIFKWISTRLPFKSSDEVTSQSQWLNNSLKCIFMQIWYHSQTA